MRVTRPGAESPGNTAQRRLQRKPTSAGHRAADEAHEREADAIADGATSATKNTAGSAAADGAGVRTTGSAGEPLPQATRSLLEPRLGHDFSRVRVHADGVAAGAARAVEARAFTLGQDIVFGAAEYAPATARGQHLLAHELTHVVQQRTSVPGGLQRKAWIGAQPLTVDEAYKKIVKATWGDKALARLIELDGDALEHRFASWNELVAEYERAKRAPPPPPAAAAAAEPDVCENLPGFGQRGGSCAAASLLTPALIWDKEQWNQGDPNARLRSILGKMRSYMQAHKDTLGPRFVVKKQNIFQSSLDLLDQIATDAADPAFQLTATHYQALGLMLMFISQDKLGSGLDSAETMKAREMMGFPGSMIPISTFDGFFEPGSALSNMQPGQMAQIVWFVKDEQQPAPASPLQVQHLPTHAFTIGRLKDGTWILNDQGYKKPLCLKGADLATLKDHMQDAADQGQWAGVTDSDSHAAASGVQTGYTILGDEKTLLP